MIIICGKTIEEVERDLEMAKMAIASGMPYGVGGATVEDAEQALAMMLAMMGDAVEPISNPNYELPHYCGHSCDYCTCNVCGGCEDTEGDRYNGEVEPIEGYRWYVCMPNGDEYTPEEQTYDTALDALISAYNEGYNLGMVGIDRVLDDNGIIEVLETILDPTDK